MSLPRFLADVRDMSLVRFSAYVVAVLIAAIAVLMFLSEYPTSQTHEVSVPRYFLNTECLLDSLLVEVRGMRAEMKRGGLGGTSR